MIAAGAAAAVLPLLAAPAAFASTAGPSTVHQGAALATPDAYTWEVWGSYVSLATCVDNAALLETFPTVAQVDCVPWPDGVFGTVYRLYILVDLGG
jgi:hypothetical protein